MILLALSLLQPTRNRRGSPRSPCRRRGARYRRAGRAVWRAGDGLGQDARGCRGCQQRRSQPEGSLQRCAFAPNQCGFENLLCATAAQAVANCTPAEHLAHFKVPKYFHFTSDFPVTVTGKVRKVEMRDMARKILELQQVK